MKLGFISDIHLDVNKYLLEDRGVVYSVERMVDDIKDVITRSELDYLFVSGDIMNTTKTKDIVQELNTTGVEVYYVVGNHDVWSVKRPTRDILSLYKRDERCLVGKTLDLGKYIVVGMYSWYDGTFDTMGKSFQYYEQMKGLWADSRFTWWDKTNRELTREFILATEDVIQTVDKDIILLNHFLPHQDFTEHKFGDDGWNFGNGYMGTDRMQKLIKEDSRIKYVTFGHTHKYFGKKEKEGVTYIGSPLGYVHEWVTESFKEQFTNTLEIIDI